MSIAPLPINLREARAAGLAVGAYHFFTFCRPGADQAKNFISVVPHDQPLLPPVVDIEFGGNCPQRPSPEQLNAELQAFLGPVEAAFGKTAIVYLTDEAEAAYAGQIAARQLWLRSLADGAGSPRLGLLAVSQQGPRGRYSRATST